MLPEPRNSEENDLLDSMGISQVFFLGLTATSTVREWVWTSDGTSVTWDAWARGENTGLEEKCVVMHRDAAVVQDKKRWISVWCDHLGEKRVVCERRLCKYS